MTSTKGAARSEDIKRFLWRGIRRWFGREHAPEWSDDLLKIADAAGCTPHQAAIYRPGILSWLGDCRAHDRLEPPTHTDEAVAVLLRAILADGWDAARHWALQHWLIPTGKAAEMHPVPGDAAVASVESAIQQYFDTYTYEPEAVIVSQAIPVDTCGEIWRATDKEVHRVPWQMLGDAEHWCVVGKEGAIWSPGA